MLEHREIKDQGETKVTRRRSLLADSFSLIQVAEKAVDVASTMTSRMRRDVAITVEALITWHLNVIKEVEVGFRQKATRGQKDATRDDASSTGPQPDVQPSSNKESISSILEEANRLLKAMGGSENLEASSTTTKPLTSSTTTVAADQSREDMMDKLQQQLNALRQKTLRVSLSRMSGGGVKGLIDSGATHPLRPLRHGDDRALVKR